MKVYHLLALAGLISGTASAAVVTNSLVQNKLQNWSHVLGVSASQKTGFGPASRAIDGNYNGSWGGGSVTHTNDNGDPASWFQVDLGKMRPVDEVTLFNRTDCCGGRLQNYSVLASNDATFATTVFDSGNQGPTGVSATIAGNGALARYVRVQRNSLAPVAGGSVISLAEIDVMGQFNYQNVALGSSASQSSTSFGGAAARAIDGNTNNSWGAGSTTHTNPNAGGAVYWETTFTQVNKINEIALYNRGDCCGGRLSNFEVSVWDGGSQVWSEQYFVGSGSVAQGGVFSIQEDTGGWFAEGNRVRVELIGGFNNDGGGTNKVLSLSEVQVFAVPEPSSVSLLGLAGVALLLRRRK